MFTTTFILNLIMIKRNYGNQFNAMYRFLVLKKTKQKLFSSSLSFSRRMTHRFRFPVLPLSSSSTEAPFRANDVLSQFRRRSNSENKETIYNHQQLENLLNQIKQQEVATFYKKNNCKTRIYITKQQKMII